MFQQRRPLIGIIGIAATMAMAMAAQRGLVVSDRCDPKPRNRVPAPSTQPKDKERIAAADAKRERRRLRNIKTSS